MNTNKQKSTTKGGQSEDFDLSKRKKKSNLTPSKVNVKSKKFWEKVVDDEGDDIEKYIR